jgi:uncharacterized protein (DUF2141 family)
MRRVVALTAALLATGGAAKDSFPRHEAVHLSCTGAPNEIRVTVTNVKKSVGLITAELYRNDPDNFLLNEGREVKLRFAAVSPATTFCLHAQDPAPYALAVYHDRNANMKIDKGAFGIPVEPYGVSNNPPMRFAAPRLEDSLFAVAEAGTSVEIALKN